MSILSRVIKNTGFLYVKMGITVLISLYTTRLILNSLGASDFGIFNVVGGAIAMLSFLNVSMAAATQRFMSYSEGEGNKEKERIIFNCAIILHLCIALGIGIILLCIKPLFFDYMLNIKPERIDAAKWIYNFTIISTMFTVMTVPYDATLNAHENMLYYSMVGIIQSLLTLLVAIFITITAKDKLIWYGALMATISIIVMIIMRVYCKKHYDECIFQPHKYYNKQLFKDMTSFAGWSLFGNSAGVVAGYGSNIVLNKFYGTILNATNGVCGQLNGQMLSFSNNMLKAVNPVIVKSEGSGDRFQMYKATFAACKLSILMYSFIAIPFVIENSYILKLWLKNVPPYAGIFSQLMIVQVMIEEISLPLGTAIGAIGKIKTFNFITSIVLYSEIVALYFCFKIGMQPYMLVILGTIVAAIQTIYKIFYCYRYCNMPLKQYINDVFLRCSIVIVLTFLFVLFIHSLMGVSFVRLIIVCVASFSIFAILFYYLGLTALEKTHLNSLIKNIIRRS
jgi:O-antigen/teichoic acid export membrane protein